MTEDSSTTVSYLLTGLLLCAPFGFGWYLLFRVIRKDIRTIRSFSFLISCTIIALLSYLGLSMFLFSKMEGRINNLLIPVTYAIGMTISFLLLPSLAITTILFILHWMRKK